MPQESLLLVAYDHHDASKRRRVRRILQEEATDWQYSLYEQRPPDSRRQVLIEKVLANKGEADDVWAFVIDPRATRIVVGASDKIHRLPSGWLLV